MAEGRGTGVRSARLSHMKRSLFGSHLYGQIVIPLMLAGVLFAIVASAVAMYFVRDLTTHWVSGVAEATTRSVSNRVERYVGQMQQIAGTGAESEVLRNASSSADMPALQLELSTRANAYNFDASLVLDDSGNVIAVAGPRPTLAISPGARPFGSLGESLPARGSTRIVTLGDVQAIVALQPYTTVDGRRFTLAIVRTLQADFVRELAGGAGVGFAIYGPDLPRGASALSVDLPSEERRLLDEALSKPSPEVLGVIRSVDGDGSGLGSIRVDGHGYEIWVQRVALAGGSPDTFVYVLGATSMALPQQAERTTIALIAFCAIAAIVLLGSIGFWVARQVSQPLDALSTGARQIAEGDYGVKVDVRGSAELAELANTFNTMTDSLRDRSESLTKKVLELATLYEMSRALGSTLDMDDLLGSVLDSALRIFDLDVGYIALRDKDTGELVVRAVRGSDTVPSDVVRSSMSEWVVREGRPLIFNPDTSGSRTGQADPITGARAALCVPLVSSEGTIGAITVGCIEDEYRFNSDDVRLLSTIGNHVTIAIGNIELFSSLQDAYLATVRSLAAAVDAKDTYTRGHSDRVAGYAIRIAEEMGLAHDQRIALEMAAYLHDIGKIGVPEEILLKPGSLSDDEMVQMRHHPLIGANILKPVAFPWAITPIVRHHHECWDGSGYPANLRGEEIPLLARILTVADSFEAMTADRPYRAGRSEAEAIEELDRCSGSQFDPRIVAAFTRILQEEESEKQSHASDSDEVGPEEVRAIFAALVDGVLASFRKLGGPRLAGNVESQLDRTFVDAGTSFRVLHGRITFTSNVSASPDGEVHRMREALGKVDELMARVSGDTLVDHFYQDALAGFSGRMHRLARDLGFCRDV